MDNTITLLHKVMDLSAVRHGVLAHNLANANTPGFVRQDVDFKDALVSAIKSGQRSQVEHVQAELYLDELSPSRPDGNNVSETEELGRASQNELLYRTAAKAVSDKLKILKSALRDR